MPFKRYCAYTVLKAELWKNTGEILRWAFYHIFLYYFIQLTVTSILDHSLSFVLVTLCFGIHIFAFGLYGLLLLIFFYWFFFFYLIIASLFFTFCCLLLHSLFCRWFLNLFLWFCRWFSCFLKQGSSPEFYVWIVFLLSLPECPYFCPLDTS